MSQKQEIFSLLGGKVTMRRGGYAPTCDAVWLAAAAPAARTVLDVGVGTGGAAMCYLARCGDAAVTGIDVSDEMLETCAANAVLNGHDIELIKADITTWRTSRTFDLVITNPPYFKGTPARHNAHHNADLAVWTRRSLARVRPRGYLCIISDATAMAEIVAAIAPKCGDIEIFSLFGASPVAERVIIRARAGTRGGARVYPGIGMNDVGVLRDGLTIGEALAKLGVQ